MGSRRLARARERARKLAACARSHFPAGLYPLNRGRAPPAPGANRTTAGPAAQLGGHVGASGLARARVGSFPAFSGRQNSKDGILPFRPIRGWIRVGLPVIYLLAPMGRLRDRPSDGCRPVQSTPPPSAAKKDRCQCRAATPSRPNPNPSDSAAIDAQHTPPPPTP